MSKPIKVLLAISYDVEHGGVQTVITTWIKNISKKNVIYDWYFGGDIKDLSLYNELADTGVKLHVGNHGVMKMSFRHPLRYVKYINSICKDIKNLLKEQNFDVIHINNGELVFSAAIARIARKCGVKCIVHSHSSGALAASFAKRALLFFVRKSIVKNVDMMAACSYEAAASMFGKKNENNTVIVKNYIDTLRFKYSSEKRQEVRKRFQLDDKFVIGQVARLSLEKNQRFLIDIYRAIYQKRPDARLLLVGEGTMEKELRSYVVDSGLENMVIFSGVTDKPEDYYSALDVFVLPSLFEGLPVTGLEAQSAGLTCIFSDAVSRDTEIIPKCKFISLKSSVEEWADIILRYFEEEKATDRENIWKRVYELGYDKSNINNDLFSLYNDVICS